MHLQTFAHWREARGLGVTLLTTLDLSTNTMQELSAEAFDLAIGKCVGVVMPTKLHLTKSELLDRVNALRWFHVMDLGHEVKTPGIYDPTGEQHGPRFGVPARLDNKTVLDIGAWDGAWSFEAKRRGAKSVLAVDKYSWGGGGWGDKRAFELARGIFGLDVEDARLDPLELSKETVGQFDVVFFFGVLYHMRHPLLALERVRDVTKPGGLAIIESHCDVLDRKEPALAFYPEGYQNDRTTWFGPNPAAAQGMLKAVGFSEVTLTDFRPEWLRMTLHAR